MRFIVTYYPDFRKASLAELGNIKEIKQLGNNMSLIETSEERDHFFASLTGKEPVFVRHIMPCDAEGAVSGRKDEDCETILDLVKQVANIEAGQRYCVQCRIVEGEADYVSKDIEVYVGSSYEENGAVPTFSDTELGNGNIMAVSVLIFCGNAYVGFSSTAQNLSFHSDEYRIASRAGAREISRAENKLKEAISRFGIEIKGEGNAIDLGAAPGGWTKVLADYGYMVYAVDPGELKESLRENKNIRHFKCRIENLELDTSFELITNDMNVDPQVTAEIMNSMAKFLTDKGLCVVTLKLPFSDVNRSLNESYEILEKCYDIIAVKNLTHNRREVTALIRKK